MNNSKILPYELSVWTQYSYNDSYIINDKIYKDPSYFKEQKIGIIGTDTMTYSGKAQNINLKQELNGTSTLTFEIYKRFYDVDTESIIENPYFEWLQNERILKLKYEDTWYSFIIKEIEESSTEFKYSITASDLFIEELSKTGYDLEFSSDQNNTSGTIVELATQVIDDTDWVIEAGPTLLQTIEEPLLKVTIANNKNLVLTSSTLVDSDNKPITKTLGPGDEAYLFYSTQTGDNNSSYLQVLYDETRQYKINDKGYVIDSVKYNYYKDGFEYTNWPFTQALEDLKVDSTRRGGRLVRSLYTVYDSNLDKIVTLYNNYTNCANLEYNASRVYYMKNAANYYYKVNIESKADYDAKRNNLYYGEQYNCYMTQQSNAPDLVKNIVLNGEVVESLNGWTTSDNAIISLIVLPEIPTGTGVTGTDIYNWSQQAKQYMQFKFNSSSSYFVNKAFQNQISNIFVDNSESDTTKYLDLPAQTRFYFRYKGTGNIDPNLRIQIIYKTTNESETRSLLELDNTIPIIQDDDQYYVQEYYLPNTLKYDDINSLELRIAHSGSNTATYNLSNIQFYKKVYLYTDSQGNSVYAKPMQDAINTNVILKDIYNFYKTGQSDVLSINEDNMDQYNFHPIYNDAYEKTRTLEIEKSNRFNIIQELNELFECWSTFKVEYNNQGFIETNDTYINYNLYHCVQDDIFDETKKYFKIITENNSNYYQIANNLTKDEFNENKALYYYVDLPYNLWTQNNNGEYILWDRLDISLKTLTNQIFLKHHRQLKSILFTTLDDSINYTGFHYGTNIQNISRTIDSNDIVTKLIVEECENSVATNGIISISQAVDNIYKTPFIYNFDYYVQSGLISEQDLNDDLYGINDGLNYFGMLSYYNNLISAVSIQKEALKTGGIGNSRTNILSKVEFYQAAINESESTITSLKADIYSKYNISIDSPSTVEIDLTKYSEDAQADLKAYVSQVQLLGEFKNNYAIYSTALNTIDAKITEYENIISKYEADKLKIENIFVSKYLPFIKEGTWSSSDYVDANLYYYDALSSLYASKSPKVTYNIDLVDLGTFDEFSSYRFKLGEKTRIYDDELFGVTGEEVLITELELNLTSPNENSITVQNYRTTFEDLFQRIAATTQEVELKRSAYDRAADAIDTTGLIGSTILEKSIQNNLNILKLNSNNTIEWGLNGLVTTNNLDGSKVKIVGGGIFLSSDGENWTSGITGNGINASQITTGILNTETINIYSGLNPTFIWNKDGLNAYKINDNNSIKYNAFVRFDQYGIYGVSQADSTYYKPSEELSWSERLADIRNVANFGLVWDGFFLRSNYNDGMIKISSDDDFQVFSKNTITNKDVEIIKIGFLDNEQSDRSIYGIRIKNLNGLPVFQTDNNGDVSIAGNITAKSGLIGGFSVDETRLYATGGPDAAIEIRPEHIVLGNTTTGSYFKATNNGKVIANDVSLSGIINATSGSIGGLIIDNIVYDEQGQIDPTHGIKSANWNDYEILEDNREGFLLSYDGTAYFNNIVARGRTLEIETHYDKNEIIKLLGYHGYNSETQLYSNFTQVSIGDNGNVGDTALAGVQILGGIVGDTLDALNPTSLMNLNSDSISFYDMSYQTGKRNTTMMVSIRSLGGKGVISGTENVCKYLQFTANELLTSETLDKIVDTENKSIYSNYLLELRNNGHLTLKPGLGGSN